MSTPIQDDKFVILIASLKGREPVRRRVRKDVIQSESSFLKEYIEDGATEIKIPLKRPKNLNLILEYLYEGQFTVSTEDHLKSLWNDARILGLKNLQKVCIQRMTDTISLDSWIQTLEFSQADGCHELESNVLSFLNANFDNCCSRPSFTSLSVDQMVQVLQLPIVKTTVRESNKIALIHDWIKANEGERCGQAHRLLEQIDLMKLTENSLRSIFDDESALRSWRSVAIFERAIRLKSIGGTSRHSDTNQGQPYEREPVEAGPAVLQSLDNRPIINVEQEVASEESSFDAIGVRQEVRPPVVSSVCGTVDNNEDGPPPPKKPRREYSQNEIETVVPSPSNQIDFVSKQKQILYFSQSRDGTPSLYVVIVSADSISRPQNVLVNLRNDTNEVPKLIWDQEARNLCFLGYFGRNFGRIVPSFNYMNGKGAPEVTALPELLHRRQHHQPVLLNGCLYVFGGSKSVTCKNNIRFSTAEVLDMTTAPRSTCQWQPIASMETRRDRYAAACVQGKIYLTGGETDKQTKNEPLIANHVACYVPGENRWKRLNSMKQFRCGHALAVLGHKIYVFGGKGYDYNDPSKHLVSMKSAEVYDVHTNTWTLIAPMLRPRYEGAAVEIEGKIYVIGGDQSNKGKRRSSVECYDPVCNSWTFVSQSVDDRGSFDSITVIDDPEYFLKGLPFFVH